MIVDIFTDTFIIVKNNGKQLYHCHIKHIDTQLYHCQISGHMIISLSDILIYNYIIAR